MTPRRNRKHTTVIYDPQGTGYVWHCSCGWYERHPSSLAVAEAGAKYHRAHMRRLREAATQ